jgi:hypothetical protein
MRTTETAIDQVYLVWHWESLNEEARDILRAAQADLDTVGELTHELVRQVMGRVARQLPAHSFEAAVDEGDGTHVLHRARAGELAPAVTLAACDPKGRPVAMTGPWRAIEFGSDVPDEVLEAIESIEAGSGWLLDREVDGSVLRLGTELPDERLLGRLVQVLLAQRPDLQEQVEGLWRVDDTDGLAQVTVRIVDGAPHVDPVKLRSLDDDEDIESATVLRWTYETAGRVPPRAAVSNTAPRLVA